MHIPDSQGPAVTAMPEVNWMSVCWFNMLFLSIGITTLNTKTMVLVSFSCCISVLILSINMTPEIY